jgi:hypothetical protein
MSDDTHIVEMLVAERDVFLAVIAAIYRVLFREDCDV